MKASTHAVLLLECFIMKRSYLSACVGCVMAAMPFTPVFAQMPSTYNTASLSLNGADFSVQLLSGTGALGSGPAGASDVLTELNGTTQTLDNPGGGDPAINSSAFLSTPFSSASASTQGFTVIENTQASKGIAYGDAGYALSYTAGAGALFEISVPYSITLHGNSLAGADLQTVIFSANGARQVLGDQETIATLGPAETDNGYLDLVIRNTSNAPQLYQFSLDAYVQSAPLSAPVPEPQPYLLMLSGLAVMAFVVYRRQDGKSIRTG